jgi:hypothetical protein
MGPRACCRPSALLERARRGSNPVQGTFAQRGPGSARSATWFVSPPGRKGWRSDRR